MKVVVFGLAFSSSWGKGHARFWRGLGQMLHALNRLWERRGRTDRFLGSLVNARPAHGGEAWGVRAGEAYAGVGTINGYRAAMRLLERAGALAPAHRP